AHDADGDPVQFSIPDINALPTGRLQGDGTLMFTPAPSEVGSYSFTVVASDGIKQATQPVSLTVTADPVTTTRISGVVENSNRQPIAGVPLDVAGVATTTAGDGSFLLDLGSGSVTALLLNVHGEQAGGGVAYPFVSLSLAVLVGHQIYMGANNTCVQPIFLTPLDTAHAVTINPTTVTTVKTPNLPGASVTVAAGTLKDSRGNPYSGPLGITQIAVDKTPLPLGDVHPDVMVMVEPTGVTFSSPAKLTLPNPSGWTAGTIMDMWTLDLPSGQFAKVGFGKVSSDGVSIQTTFPGISSSTVYFFLPDSSPIGVTGDPFTPLYGEAPQPQLATFGSEVELYAG